MDTSNFLPVSREEMQARHGSPFIIQGDCLIDKINFTLEWGFSAKWQIDNFIQQWNIFCVQRIFSRSEHIQHSSVFKKDCLL